MPSPLPIDWAAGLRLRDSVSARLEAISFFVAALILCAVAFRWLWNSLGKDFPRLPRMSLARSLSLVVLWGLLFIVVLTMISGARELMTPGAWERQGATYRLAEESASPAGLADKRAALEVLRTELFIYATRHEGRFPADRAEVAEAKWEVPGQGGLLFQYRAGEPSAVRRRPLVVEPESDPHSRLVLWTSGEILVHSTVEIRQWAQESAP
jgi:hypothetical protein